MAQYSIKDGINISSSGVNLEEGLNLLQDAISSGYSGASRPSYLAAGGTWVDTTEAKEYKMYFYDGTTDLLVFTANPSSNVITVNTSVVSAVENNIATFDSEGMPKDSGVSITKISLVKTKPNDRVFYLDGADLKTSQVIQFGTFTKDVDTTVTLPTILGAKDYKIYGLSDGTLSSQLWDDPVPSDSFLIGGFHSAYSDSAIVPQSIWDEGYRPQCSPRSMVQSHSGAIWADIYLMDTDYGLNGYSQADVTIADSLSPPIVPSIYGGNGVTTYGSFTWFEAWDLATSAEKRLPSWGEFSSLAFGVVEQQSVGSDPVTTKYQAGHRSAIGMEQATGVVYQWGSDTQGSGAGWSAITDGRGSVYSSSLTAVLLGANWLAGVIAGSRSAYWDNSPSFSGNAIGARAVCNHMIL